MRSCPVAVQVVAVRVISLAVTRGGLMTRPVEVNHFAFVLSTAERIIRQRINPINSLLT